MIQLPDGRIDQVYFGFQAGRLAAVASSDDQVVGRISGLEPFIRLKDTRGAPPPAKALSYFRIGEGKVALLCRWRDVEGGDAGRNDSRVLIADEGVLPVDVALGLHNWSEWQAPPKSPRLPALPTGDLQAWGQAGAARMREDCMSYDNGAAVRAALGRVAFDGPTDTYTVIGCRDRLKLPVVWALQDILQDAFPPGYWTFSTYETDDAGAGLPNIVFMDARPLAGNPNPRKIVDLTASVPANPWAEQVWAEFKEIDDPRGRPTIIKLLSRQAAEEDQGVPVAAGRSGREQEMDGQQIARLGAPDRHPGNLYASDHGPAERPTGTTDVSGGYDHRDPSALRPPGDPSQGPRRDPIPQMGQVADADTIEEFGVRIKSLRASFDDTMDNRRLFRRFGGASVASRMAVALDDMPGSRGRPEPYHDILRLFFGHNFEDLESKEGLEFATQLLDQTESERLGRVLTRSLWTRFEKSERPLDAGQLAVRERLLINNQPPDAPYGGPAAMLLSATAGSKRRSWRLDPTAVVAGLLALVLVGVIGFVVGVINSPYPPAAPLPPTSPQAAEPTTAVVTPPVNNDIAIRSVTWSIPPADPQHVYLFAHPVNGTRAYALTEITPGRKYNITVSPEYAGNEKGPYSIIIVYATPQVFDATTKKAPEYAKLGEAGLNVQAELSM